MDNREYRVNMVELEKKVDALSIQVETLTTSIEGLLAAWNASSKVLSVIKWLAGLGAAIAVIMAEWYGRK